MYPPNIVATYFCTLVLLPLKYAVVCYFLSVTQKVLKIKQSTRAWDVREINNDALIILLTSILSRTRSEYQGYCRCKLVEIFQYRTYSNQFTQHFICLFYLEQNCALNCSARFMLSKYGLCELYIARLSGLHVPLWAKRIKIQKSSFL